MGVMYIAECSCGFHSDDLFVGSGMGRDAILIPFHCYDCGFVWIHDAEIAPSKCIKCKSVNFHDLLNFDPFMLMIKFRHYRALDGLIYLSGKDLPLATCPGCNNKTLKFAVAKEQIKEEDEDKEQNEIYSAKCPCGVEYNNLTVKRWYQCNYIPVACSTCHRVWVQDAVKGRKKCRKCKSPIYYLLPQDADMGDTYSCDLLGPDLCPKCGKKELKFKMCGMWD